MAEVRNLNHKLIGDISPDKRLFEIRLKDCVTQIQVKPNGTLGVTHMKKAEHPPRYKN